MSVNHRLITHHRLLNLVKISLNAIAIENKCPFTWTNRAQPGLIGFQVVVDKKLQKELEERTKDRVTNLDIYEDVEKNIIYRILFFMQYQRIHTVSQRN